MRTKHIITLLSILAISLSAAAQAAGDKKDQAPEYQFTTVKENPVTHVQDQFRSGTCWCFSGLSLIESEIIRKYGKTLDLSEMWVVGHAYCDRAKKYVRMDGHMGFSAGSGFGDVFQVIKKYGIVPQSVYSGMEYGYDKPVQAEMDAVLKAYVDAIVRQPNKSGRDPMSLSTAWKKGFDAVVQAYLGQWPAEFTYDGKTYTPESFRDECIKLDFNDYVNICSFQEEPWYEVCPIEVCDNWRGYSAYNVPVKELIEIIYQALDKGFTLAWGGDVSEKGFTRNGVGVVPKPMADAKPVAGSDQEHWVGKSPEKDPEYKDIPDEIEVSDSLRQAAYDRKATTDDHGMHIYGYATDQKGHKYFKVKNSWGTANKYAGTWYMSETFIAYKTLNIIVHKDALSKEMRKKLNIK